MNGSQVAMRSLAVALCLTAGTVCPVYGAADAGPISVTHRGAVTSIAVSGTSIRETTGTVSRARVIRLERSSKVIALWDEASGGAVEHYYGLSLDAGRTFPLILPTTYDVRLIYSEFDPARGEPQVSANLSEPAAGRLYMVQFVVPPLDEFRRDLSALGATVERFLTDHTNVVTMDAAAAARVAALPYVRWVGRYHTAYRLSPEVRAELASNAPEIGPKRYSIECLGIGRAPQQRIADQVQKLGGIVEVTTPDGYRMEATLTRAQLLEIAAMDDVNYIDPWGGPGGYDMNVIRQLIGATNAQGAGIGGCTGQGVRGEVFDTEVRVTHQAFQSPPALLHGGSAGNGSASGYHGSACYGINFADWPSNPTYNGVVTSAEQGIFYYYPLCTQFGGSQTRLAANTEAVNATGTYKSSYQSSSIGSAQVTAYTTVSAEVDDYLMRVDYLSCQSQSNTGNQNSRPQAWAKNIVSVGGVNWMSTLSRTDDDWNGASYGPAADQRVKPDLANCFDSIPTTWGQTSDSGTTSFSGTSGATPITAGCFGILQQMWHQSVFPGFGGGSSVFADRPRSTTAKAMMINTAYRYPLTQGGLTRARQGWGMPALDTLYNLRNKMFIVNETDALTTGQTKTYQVNVSPSEATLAVTMAYIDPQGNPAASQARINDLSLRVTSPTGTIYWGNGGLITSNLSTSGGSANTIDTVENVFIQNPPSGQWTIDVIGTSIVQDANLATVGVTDAAFGLVASGVSGAALTIALPTGVPDLIPPNVPTDIAVTITPGAQTVAGANLMYRSGPAGSFISLPMTNPSGNDYIATIPSPECGDTPQFYVIATGNLGAVVTYPPTAPTPALTTQVGTAVVRFTDDMEQDKGWSGAVADDTATTGRWTRNTSQATAAQPAGNHTLTGSICWVTDYRAGSQASDYDVDGGKTTLTSPLFDASNLDQATISYWRWYSNGTSPLNPNTNVFQIDISNDDGSSWTNAELLGPSGADTEPSWIQHSFLIADVLPPTATMRMRFVASDYSDSIVEAAIDDFAVSGVTCPRPCYANCDSSSTPPVLNANDFNCFMNRFAAGESWANCDGSTAAPALNVNDFVCFLNQFAVGCS